MLESNVHCFVLHSIRKETAYVNAAALFRASNDGFYLVSIALFNLFTFVTYTLTTGMALTPNIVFTSLTLVTGLRLSTIVYMVEAILGMQEARVALQRIQVCTAVGATHLRVSAGGMLYCTCACVEVIFRSQTCLTLARSQGRAKESREVS